MERNIKVIAKIKTDFKTKFGIPRQSGLCNSEALIVFEPEYQKEEAFRGIEGFSHLWLIWEFSKAVKENWSPTVRPPRLGGNKKMGVFATRSPFRPNPIGLSSVKLIGVEKIDGQIALRVSGADLMDGTPIYDVKPYLAYTDAHIDAVGGFTDDSKDNFINVVCDDEQLNKIPSEKQKPLLEVLKQDPRPRYIDDEQRVYGFVFADYEVKFKVENDLLIVVDIYKV